MEPSIVVEDAQKSLDELWGAMESLESLSGAAEVLRSLGASDDLVVRLVGDVHCRRVGDSDRLSPYELHGALVRVLGAQLYESAPSVADLLRDVGWDVRKNRAVEAIAASVASLVFDGVIDISRAPLNFVYRLMGRPVGDDLKPGERAFVAVSTGEKDEGVPVDRVESIDEVCDETTGDPTTRFEALLGGCPEGHVRLFHGTTAEHLKSIVDGVEIKGGNPRLLDFGAGFYTTPLIGFAAKHAEKRSAGSRFMAALVVLDLLAEDLEKLWPRRKDFSSDEPGLDEWRVALQCNRDRGVLKRGSSADDLVTGPIWATSPTERNAMDAKPMRTGSPIPDQQWVFRANTMALNVFISRLVVFSAAAHGGGEGGGGGGGGA
jgi:hypothetical protein